MYVFKILQSPDAQSSPNPDAFTAILWNTGFLSSLVWQAGIGHTFLKPSSLNTEAIILISVKSLIMKTSQLLTIHKLALTGRNNIRLGINYTSHFWHKPGNFVSQDIYLGQQTNFLFPHDVDLANTLLLLRYNHDKLGVTVSYFPSICFHFCLETCTSMFS